MQLGPAEILVVAIIALIVLGPDRLPKAARQIGSAIGELKKLSSGVQEQINDAMSDDSPTLDKPKSDSKVQIESHPGTEGFRLIDGQGSSNKAGEAEEEPETSPRTTSDRLEHPSNGNE